MDRRSNELWRINRACVKEGGSPGNSSCIGLLAN